MRGQYFESSIKCIQGINLELRFGEHTINVPACVVGKELRVLCSEFPMQNWIIEHKKEILDYVREEVEQVRILKIYADLHK